MLCMFLQSLTWYAHDVDDFSITLLPRGLHRPKSGTDCTVLRSTPDDAKDVDRARYGDEGKNSWHFVSNEQIPLPVRDHIGRTTAETRQQLELKYAAHVASATNVNN